MKIREKIDSGVFNRKLVVTVKKYMKFNHTLLNANGETLFQFVYQTLNYIAFMKQCERKDKKSQLSAQLPKKLGFQPSEISEARSRSQKRNGYDQFEGLRGSQNGTARSSSRKRSTSDNARRVSEERSEKSQDREFFQVARDIGNIKAKLNMFIQAKTFQRSSPNQY